VLPLVYTVIHLSLPLAIRSYVMNEYSSNAGGLIRWPVFALLPLGFLLLGIQALSELIKRIAFLKGLVPASGGGTVNFLRADGTFAVPPGTGAFVPTGTGFPHITAGVEDAASKLVDTADINNDQVTYPKIQNVSAAARLLGRITAGAGDIEELTGTQATTLLDVFTSVLKGLVPASGGGTTNFLRADGTFAAPPAASLTSTQASLTTAVAISASTYADLTGASVSLAAGTWLLIANVLGSAANLAFLMHAAITDGANAVQQEGSQFVPASGTASVHAWGSLGITCIVSPGSTTTYKLRAARGLTTLTNTWTAQDGAGFNTLNNASDGADHGTNIVAVKIA